MTDDSLAGIVHQIGVQPPPHTLFQFVETALCLGSALTCRQVGLSAEPELRLTLAHKVGDGLTKH